VRPALYAGMTTTFGAAVSLGPLAEQHEQFAEPPRPRGSRPSAGSVSRVEGAPGRAGRHGWWSGTRAT